MEINNHPVGKVVGKERVSKLEKIFVEIYHQESDAIFRFCFLRVSDRDLALDLTQETFMRLWQSLLLNKNIRNHRAFLFTIARNKVIDWYRKKKPLSLEALRENLHDDGSIISLVAKESVIMEVEAKFLIDKIKELSEPYSRAVYLRYVEEFKPREISRILGESSNVISARINRGVKQLREVLHSEHLKNV